MFKKEEILHLEADSPENLGKQLEYLQEAGKIKRHGLASLDIYGHTVLTRQFELPMLKSRDISNALKMEAVELLSTAPHDLEVDYRTIMRSKDKVSGVFVAVSKRMLEQYVAFLRKSKLVPISIGVRILNVMNAFLYSHVAGLQDKIFCMIDCAQKSIVDLAVFEKGNLRLLREIPYSGIEELKQEISQSLRYYLSKDGTKKLSEVYVSGEIPQSDALLKTLEQDFEAKIITDSFDKSHKKPGAWKKRRHLR
jgi:Tfp pilus assembly PilM family ATPase